MIPTALLILVACVWLIVTTARLPKLPPETTTKPCPHCKGLLTTRLGVTLKDGRRSRGGVHDMDCWHCGGALWIRKP